MRPLAFWRIALGAFAWIAPRLMNRIGEARRLWHRLWLLCDSADTAMGIGMVARGSLRGVTALQALAITGSATAVDLVALAQERREGAAPPGQRASESAST